MPVISLRGRHQCGARGRKPVVQSGLEELIRRNATGLCGVIAAELAGACTAEAEGDTPGLTCVREMEAFAGSRQDAAG